MAAEQGQANTEADNKILNYLNVKAVQYANENGRSNIALPPPMPFAGVVPQRSISLSWIIGIIVIIFLIHVSSSTSDYFQVAPYSQLSRDLADRGWYVFTASYCGFCTKQKQIIGNNYPNIVECDTKIGSPPSGLSCSSVHAYPTWYNAKTGQKVEGYLNERDLRALL
jgi:hypothetical protein